jgi:ketosteroid isomerase-like protein
MMSARNLKFAILLVLLLLPLSRLGAQNGTAESAVLARMKAETAAWGTLDASKIKPFYSADPKAVYFDLSPLEYHGAATFVEGSLKGLAEFSAMSLTLRGDAEIHPIGADTAWATATVEMATVTKAGKKDAMPIRWTSVWHKSGGTWINVHEHWSQPAP